VGSAKDGIDNIGFFSSANIRAGCAVLGEFST
jgi:hypothetical protein